MHFYIRHSQCFTKRISRHERSQDTLYHICFTMTLQEMITDMRVSASSDTKVALTLFNKKKKKKKKNRTINFYIYNLYIELIYEIALESL